MIEMWETVISFFKVLFLGLSDKTPLTFVEAWTILILFLTMLAAIIYACFTYRMLRESKKQTELQTRPYVVIGIELTNKFYLKNVGNSAAFNIIVTTTSFKIIDKPNNQKYETKFSCNDLVPVLEAKGKRELEITTYVDGIVQTFSNTAFLNPRFQNNKNYPIYIWYNNAVGIKYVTKLQTGKDGLTVLYCKKNTMFFIVSVKLCNYVYNLLKRIGYWVKSLLK